METNNETLRREKKQLLRSCESCRSSKTRCIPDTISDEKCQRCARREKECLFSEVRSRSKKGQPSQRRIAEVEKKINDVYSLLRTGRGPQQGTTPLPSVDTLLPSTTRSEHKSSSHPSGVSLACASSAYQIVSSSSFQPGRSREDVIGKGIISTQEAESLIKTFISDYWCFPFVILPANTIAGYRRERPILLLSVLAITSRKYFELHNSLELEFREILSTKVIFEGAKDLDLLQGLLVYLAWYHFHFKPQGKQMYMLAQIAVTMAVDLDIEKLTVAAGGTPFAAEARRTFVGVYYLSSCISMVHRKQITMRYSEDVGDCCRSLVETAHVPSDIRLIHFIQLQRLAEEITSTFGYDDVSHRLPHSRIEGTELLVTAFKSRLRELRTSFPTNGICHSSINLAYDSVCVYLYEVSLHDRRPAPKQSRDFSYQLQQPYHARTNLLVGCLEATKTFLDDYLQISSHTLEFHTILEKGQLAHAIVVLIRLAFCTNPGLDIVNFRQACSVSYYLDAVAEHVGRVSGTPDDAEHHDSFYRFKQMGNRIKAWYERAVSLEQNGSPHLQAGSLRPSDLKEPSQLAEIGKAEQSVDFDMSSMDFLSLEGNDFWEQLQRSF